jgi:hypothetical protein
LTVEIRRRPYALRPLLHDVPLSADGANEDIKINCVEYQGYVHRPWTLDRIGALPEAFTLAG